MSLAAQTHPPATPPVAERPASMRMGADEELYDFLLTDLIGADWVLSAPDDVSDADLAREFRRIHHIFLVTSKRPRQGMFKGLDQGFLVSVVRDWMQLYKAGLEDLRARFPLRRDRHDLVVEGVNWSHLLGIRAEGLLKISYVSRYAELWAERSLSVPSLHETWARRLAFVGDPLYRAHFDWSADDRWLVLDEMGNAIPSFDLLAAVSALHDVSLVRPMIAARRWEIDTGDDAMIEEVFAASRDLPEALRGLDYAFSRDPDEPRVLTW